MHGSPWRYDAQKIHRLVHPVDVAPTIAALLGMTAPASAKGLPLVEVLE